MGYFDWEFMMTKKTDLEKDEIRQKAEPDARLAVIVTNESILEEGRSSPKRISDITDKPSEIEKAEALVMKASVHLQDIQTRLDTMVAVHENIILALTERLEHLNEKYQVAESENQKAEKLDIDIQIDEAETELKQMMEKHTSVQATLREELSVAEDKLIKAKAALLSSVK